jgi:urease accessory protein
MHLASSSLPIGGFAYSQALEQVCETGQVHDLDSAQQWIGDYLRLVVARQELPWWIAVYTASERASWDDVIHATESLRALRETAELRLESRQMAHAISRLYEQWLSPEQLRGLPSHLIDSLALDYSAAHAFLCGLRGLGVQTGLCAWIWSWLDTQVLAAVKLVPLGQRDGQRLLHGLKPMVFQSIETSLQLPCEQAASAPFGLAMASARHETQYARLFRS